MNDRDHRRNYERLKYLHESLTPPQTSLSSTKGQTYTTQTGQSKVTLGEQGSGQRDEWQGNEPYESGV